MIDFEDTIKKQKLLLTRIVMVLGGLASLSFVFQVGRPLVTILSGCLGTFLLVGQWWCGKKEWQKAGALASILGSTAVLVIIIVSGDHPTITGTHYLFTSVVAATVVLLGKTGGAVILAFIISFDASLIFNWISDDQSYLTSSPDVFVDRTASLAMVFGIVAYSEHTMMNALNQLKDKDHQLLLKEKLAALGVFAGGVSHEINNPLAIIKGFIGQIRRWMIKAEAPAEIQQKLDRLNSNVQRITDVTHSLLALGFDSPINKSLAKPFSLHDVAVEALEILRTKLNYLSTIQVRNEIKETLFVYGSPNHLRIMIRIIVDNALDALEVHEQEGKEIHITASLIKDTILLVVSDNGPGIPLDIQKNIFDPFFTTKEVGKGSGVGLALVAKLCNSLDWKIAVDSHPGLTKFTLTLSHGEEILQQGQVS